MRARKPMVVGNWKMNGNRSANAQLLAGVSASVGGGVLAGVEVTVCPPYPYIEQAVSALAGTGIAVGAQDVAAFEDGAFTGEVSGAMLRDIGCAAVLVGHSERRTLLAETDAAVAAKAARAMAAGLQVIVCVGETLADREAGRTEAVLGAQIDALASLGAADAAGFVIAYEPVWAIGTGRTASPEQAQEVHAFIRARLTSNGFAAAPAIRLLYGGSVKSSNAASLFAMPDIDGGLIGGAALSADDFAAICRSAAGA